MPVGLSLKERTGRSSKGKVEENKQTDKTVNETLVFCRGAKPSVPLGNKTEEGSGKKRETTGEKR